MKKISVFIVSMTLSLNITFSEGIGFYQGNGKYGPSNGTSKEVATPDDSVHARKQREEATAAERKPAKFFSVPLGITPEQLLEERMDVEDFSGGYDYPKKEDHSIKQYTTKCRQQGVEYKKVYSFFNDKLYAAGAVIPYNTDEQKEVAGYMLRPFREQAGIPADKVIMYENRKVITRTDDVVQYLMATATHDGHQMNIIMNVDSSSRSIFNYYGYSGGTENISVILQLSNVEDMKAAKAHAEQAKRDADNYVSDHTDW